MRDNRKPEPARALEHSVGYELGRAFRRLNRAVSASLREHKVSAVQINILLTLWSYGAMTVGELQKRMAFSSSSFTGALDRMERADLVHRVPAPNDRRSYLVEPARWPGGRRKTMLNDLIAAEEDFLGALDHNERTELLRLLQKIGSKDRQPRSG